MPVTHDQGVEVTTYLRFGSSDFDRTAHDRASSANDSIASFNSKGVAVSKKKAVSMHLEESVGLLGDVELDSLVSFEVLGGEAVDVPIKARMNSMLVAWQPRRTPVIPNHTGYEHPFELFAKLDERRGNDARQLDNSLIGGSVVCRK